MKYKELLLSIYNEAKNDISYTKYIKKSEAEKIELITQQHLNQKGVYTVLITLSIYKIAHPQQDIRNHQTQIPNGFSGRSIDTKFITPTLKELGLPAMAESGWLTRSLEHPSPYTLDYKGQINNKEVKSAFLELIHAIEKKKLNPKHFLVELIKGVIKTQENNTIIRSLSNPENLTIDRLIKALKDQFSKNYGTFGGSKLPVISFYALYKIIVDELDRYKDCTLKSLGSHTASDRTSESSGDIEIFRDGILFETIEIKLKKQIDVNILRIAKDKIVEFNPKRYYIFSSISMEQYKNNEIETLIKEIEMQHGCQIIINGIVPTLKYYLRLISDINEFVKIYSELVQNDLELKPIHKETWSKLILGLNNAL